MDIVGACARLNRDHGSGRETVLRVKVVGDDFELLGCICIRKGSRQPLIRVVVGCAVKNIVCASLLASIGRGALRVWEP